LLSRNQVLKDNVLQLTNKISKKMKTKISIVLAVMLVLGVATTYYLKQADAEPLKENFVKNEVFTKKEPVLSYNIGDAVADFKVRSTDSKTISLANYASAKGFIIVFTSNHCPFSKAYEDRVIALDKKYASQGFPVIAISPNDPEAYEEDSFANMQAKVKEKGYAFPYCADENQVVSKAFGAARTPHVFVLKKEGDKNVVEYMGAIDDNAQDAAGVTKRYVEDAVNNLLAGKPVVTNTTKAVGCAIKWKS
jgi:glutathione peroxidase-family protein